MTAPKQKRCPVTFTTSLDTVCHHSGVPPADCDYHCTSCEHSCVLVGDPAELARRAEAIRDTWPQWRLDQQENRQWEMEIPEATRVTDHMRRRAPHDQQ